MRQKALSHYETKLVFGDRLNGDGQVMMSLGFME